MNQFDIFISFKNTENELPTRDSVIAMDIYNFLISKGLKVFISNVVLEQLGVAAYKSAIDDALDSSIIMIVVGTNVDFINSKWIKYEWDSFSNDILSGLKTEGKIFSVVENIKNNDLPRTLRQNQVFQYTKESLDSLLKFITNSLKIGIELSEGTTKTHHVFISYSSKEKNIADAVCNTLEENGIKCWIAPRDIPLGSSYAEAIIKGIEKSNIFILILSDNSQNSGWVIREVERAVNKGICILPFRIEKVIPNREMELFITTLKVFDAFDETLEIHIRQLVNIVKKII